MILLSVDGDVDKHDHDDYMTMYLKNFSQYSDHVLLNEKG